MKTCRKCQIEKPSHEFWRQNTSKDGLQSHCVQCMSASHKRWKSGVDDEYLSRRSARNKVSMDRSRARDPLLQMFRSIKSRAKEAGLEFSLSVSDIKIPERCPVLGIPLVFGVRRGRGLAERDQRPSVDRIDNTRGYTPDNIIVVSFRANRIKSDADAHELRAIADFYGGLHATRRTRDLPKKQDERQSPDNVSRMQLHKTEEERPVLKRNAG